MKSFKKKVKRNRFYREYVDVLNGKLHLSTREADILAVLLQLNAEWGSMVKETGNVLSTDIRRVLLRESLVTKSNLARYITNLTAKGILVSTGVDNNVKLNEDLLPELNEDVCEIRFILELI
jgi:hypothetical protein